MSLWSYDTVDGIQCMIVGFRIKVLQKPAAGSSTLITNQNCVGSSISSMNVIHAKHFIIPCHSWNVPRVPGRFSINHLCRTIPLLLWTTSQQIKVIVNVRSSNIKLISLSSSTILKCKVILNESITKLSNCEHWPSSSGEGIWNVRGLGNTENAAGEWPSVRLLMSNGNSWADWCHAGNCEVFHLFYFIYSH